MEVERTYRSRRRRSLCVALRVAARCVADKRYKLVRDASHSCHLGCAWPVPLDVLRVEYHVSWAQPPPDDGIAVDLMLHDLRAAMVTLSGLARRKARKIEKASRFTCSERAPAALSKLLPRSSVTLMVTKTQCTRLAGQALPHRPGQSRLRGFSTQPPNPRWDAGGAAR